MVNLLRSLRSFAANALALIGRHPTPILVLPSLAFLLRYLPFWKDIDATVQLVAPAYDDNILHFPPIYSFLARLPFFLTDTILGGHPPGIFERQHPSLVAVYALVIVQHLGLVIALRYFLFSWSSQDLARGLVTCFLASIASFYSFAHTCGSEAMTPVTYFLVFGAGIRALLDRATWRTWVIYTSALVLAMGCRHINGVLMLWLPGVALWNAVIAVQEREHGEQTGVSGSGDRLAIPPAGSTEQRIRRGWNSSVAKRSRRLLFTALVCTLLSVGVEQGILQWMCFRFGVTSRSSLGSAMSGRIATWVDPLSAPQKQALLDSVQKFTADPLVKLAVQFQIQIGSYDKGTGVALSNALQEKGFNGEALFAERDRLISQSSFCFYRTLDPRLFKEILSDFWHGFLPTNDQGIAIAGPKATFFSLDRIEQTPGDWEGVATLPIFLPANAKATLARATEDNLIRHWRWMPILAWTLLFLGVGIWRAARGALPSLYLAIGLSILGIGLLVYAANCVCIYTLPRYALPMLVAVIAFGCFMSAATSGVDRRYLN